MAAGKTTIGNTSTSIVAINHQRNILVIANDSDETMYLAANEAAVLNQGVRLKIADSMALFEGDPGLTDAWNGICATGGKNASHLER